MLQLRGERLTADTKARSRQCKAHDGAKDDALLKMLDRHLKGSMINLG